MMSYGSPAAAMPSFGPVFCTGCTGCAGVCGYAPVHAAIATDSPTAASARGIMVELYTTLPHATAALPGTGGVLRASDEDFVVDEVPAYAPSGTGDHVFVRIEKRGLTTPDAVRAIARALGIRERDVGVAGMKDRHAVTRQWICLPPPVAPEQVRALALPSLVVLDARATATSCAPATCARTASASSCGARATPARARAVLGELARPPGAPNWFGEQRFGHHGDNAERGRALLAGGPRGASQARPPDDLGAAVGAVQRWLVARLADGLYRRALAGDVLHKRGGGQFACERRRDRRRRASPPARSSPTGPMFGDAMRRPADGSDAAAREDAILAAAGLARDAFHAVRAIAEGTRRDAAIAVDDAAVEPHEDGLVVCFTLPAGAYATTVMREVMKAP